MFRCRNLITINCVDCRICSALWVELLQRYFFAHSHGGSRISRGGDVSGRISIPICIAAAVALLVSGIGTDLQATTRANDRLTAPNALLAAGAALVLPHRSAKQSQVLVLACAPHASSGEGVRIPRSIYRSRHSGIGKSCRQRSALTAQPNTLREATPDVI